MTIQSVGISDRDGGDAGIALEDALSTIADGLAGLHIADLENGRFKRRHIIYNMIVDRIYPVQAKAKADHIEVALRKALDAGAVADMAQDLMRKSGLQLLRGFVEEFELMIGESVERGTVAAHKMGEDGARDQGGLMVEAVDQGRHIVERIKAEALHTRIELDVDREIGDALLFGSADEGFQQTKIIDFGL